MEQLQTRIMRLKFIYKVKKNNSRIIFLYESDIRTSHELFDGHLFFFFIIILYQVRCINKHFSFTLCACLYIELSHRDECMYDC
jgi:hypothetical protein